MAARLYDAFGRSTATGVLTPLGISDSGHEWVPLTTAQAATGVFNNAARFESTAAGVIAATLDAGVLGGDGELGCTLLGNGAGLGLYFRVQDVSNWWRSYQRVYTYTYQSGTETYVSGYTQVLTGYQSVIVGYTPTEYEWRQNYSTGITHGYSDMYGLHTVSTWSSSSSSAPYFPPVSHMHYLNGSYYPGDTTSHSHSKSGSPYRTGATRGGQPIYQQQPVYASQPVYSTRTTYSSATGYELRLERMLSGTLSTRAARQISGPFRKLRVQLKDSAINAFVDSNTQPVSVVDASLQGATRHGIGRGKPSEKEVSNTDLIDAFYFNPLSAGSSQPPVLL